MVTKGVRVGQYRSNVPAHQPSSAPSSDGPSHPQIQCPEGLAFPRRAPKLHTIRLGARPQKVDHVEVVADVD